MAKSYQADDEHSFMITTVSGTVYRLSEPDALGYRAIRRIMGQKENTKGGSVVIKKDTEKAEPTSKSFFKGKMLQEISVGSPLLIEIFGEQRTLMSEPVKKIEVCK
ncbi:MAG: hypothetical protein N2234_01305 [Planctomycetota bacterium]|nr:hypothetical protein [Planctomycetota bacterium]